ncbi:MAG: hypothetical protein ACYDBB_22535 [Armatimonadota bacterium]
MSEPTVPSATRSQEQGADVLPPLRVSEEPEKASTPPPSRVTEGVGRITRKLAKRPPEITLFAYVLFVQTGVMFALSGFLLIALISIGFKTHADLIVCCVLFALFILTVISGLVPLRIGTRLLHMQRGILTGSRIALSCVLVVDLVPTTFDLIILSQKSCEPFYHHLPLSVIIFTIYGLLPILSTILSFTLLNRPDIREALAAKEVTGRQATLHKTR